MRWRPRRASLWRAPAAAVAAPKWLSWRNLIRLVNNQPAVGDDFPGFYENNLQEGLQTQLVPMALQRPSYPRPHGRNFSMKRRSAVGKQSAKWASCLQILQTHFGRCVHAGQRQYFSADLRLSHGANPAVRQILMRNNQSRYSSWAGLTGSPMFRRVACNWLKFASAPTNGCMTPRRYAGR